MMKNVYLVLIGIFVLIVLFFAALETRAAKQEKFDEEEIRYLAQLIEAEAGIEDYIGKCLVADVVLNRVDSLDYPNTIEDVIQDRFPCVQFSTVSIYNGSFDAAKDNISTESLSAARHEYISWKTGDDCMTCDNEELIKFITDIHGTIDHSILFFTNGNYNPYCIPAYKHGEHYFGY